MRRSNETRLIMIEKQLVELNKQILETQRMMSREVLREEIMQVVTMRTEEISKLTKDCVQALGTLCEEIPEVRERLNAVVGR